MSDTPLPPGKKTGKREQPVWDRDTAEYKAHKRKIQERHRSRAREQRMARMIGTSLPPGKKFNKHGHIVWDRNSIEFRKYDLACKSLRIKELRRGPDGDAYRERQRNWRNTPKIKARIDQKRRDRRIGPNGDAIRAREYQLRRLRDGSYLRQLTHGAISRNKRHRVVGPLITVAYIQQLWLNQTGRCAITNKRMIRTFGSLFSASIDRIDNTIAYCEGNVQLVCQGINYAKNRFSDADIRYFLQHDRAPSESDPKQLEFAW